MMRVSVKLRWYNSSLSEHPRRQCPGQSPSTGFSPTIDNASGRCPARILSPRHLGRLLDLAPQLLLGEEEETREHDQEHEHLHAEALSRLEVRLGRPGEEGRDIARVLLSR